VAGPVARADHPRGFAAAGEEGKGVGHGDAFAALGTGLPRAAPAPVGLDHPSKSLS
jgi:hypothetical protein